MTTVQTVHWSSSCSKTGQGVQPLVPRHASCPLSICKLHSQFIDSTCKTRSSIFYNDLQIHLNCFCELCLFFRCAGKASVMLGHVVCSKQRLDVLAGYLAEALKIKGPFLVVVPLSTVPNWIKEFRKWTPQLNALVYVGDSKSREVIRNYEFFNTARGTARPYRFEVSKRFSPANTSQCSSIPC